MILDSLSLCPATRCRDTQARPTQYRHRSFRDGGGAPRRYIRVMFASKSVARGTVASALALRFQQISHVLNRELPFAERLKRLGKACNVIIVHASAPSEEPTRVSMAAISPRVGLAPLAKCGRARVSTNEAFFGEKSGRRASWSHCARCIASRNRDRSGAMSRSLR